MRFFLKYLATRFFYEHVRKLKMRTTRTGRQSDKQIRKQTGDNSRCACMQIQVNMVNDNEHATTVQNREKRHVFTQSFVRSVVHSLLASFLDRLYSLSTETASVTETQNQEHGLSQNSHPVHSASVRDERCEDLGIRTGQGRKPSRYKARLAHR